MATKLEGVYGLRGRATKNVFFLRLPLLVRLKKKNIFRNRAGSGSFNGAYESEEDMVAFAGMRDQINR